MTLVERIKLLCEKEGLSLTALEKNAGIGRGSIWRWDENAPSIDKISAVAEYFNVSIDYLIGRVNKPDAILWDRNLPDELTQAGIKAVVIAKDALDRGLTPEDLQEMIRLFSEWKQRAQD